MTPVALCLLAAAAVAATLWSEARAPRLEWLFKPLAALCFIALALDGGALDSGYGRILLLGLVLCFGGDVLLIASNDRAFLAGLGSFLLGHVAYAVAFANLELQVTTLLVGVVPALLLAVLSLRWLWPQLPDRMRLPVLAYILVICTMLTLAASTWGAPVSLPIIVGAWGFAISDLSVARNQFVVRSHWNRLWGLPLYFASQMLLAWTVRLVA